MKRVLELAFAAPVAGAPDRRRGVIGRSLPAQPSLSPWMLLAGELALALSLLISGKLPAILVRGLLLFLRF